MTRFWCPETELIPPSTAISRARRRLDRLPRLSVRRPGSQGCAWATGSGADRRGRARARVSTRLPVLYGYPLSTKIHLLPDLGNSRHLASPPSTSSDRPRGSCGHSILGCPDVNHHPGAGCLRGLLEQCALEVGLHYYHARASVTTRSSICVAPGAAGRARAIATSAAGCDQDWYRT